MIARGLALLVSAALLGACGGSPAPKAYDLTQATPNLAGKTIRMVNSAPPDVSDTVIYLAVKKLRQWGATVTLDNVQGDPVAVKAVLGGSADVATRSSTAPDINSGLVAFGPSQPHVDYFLVTAASIKTIEQLKGHSFAVSNTGGIEAAMYHAEMALHKLNEKDVPLMISGGAAVRVQALLAGKLDATFAHADGYLTLKDHGLNSVATVARDVPDLAAGYWSAQSSWLQANPDLAVAIDMAWLWAAHIFQTDEKAFIAATQEYAKGTQPDSYYDAYYKIVKPANTWPDDGSGFSDEAIAYNQKLAVDTKATDKQVPASEWSTTKYWTQAVKNVLRR